VKISGEIRQNSAREANVGSLSFYLAGTTIVGPTGLIEDRAAEGPGSPADQRLDGSYSSSRTPRSRASIEEGSARN